MTQNAAGLEPTISTSLPWLGGLFSPSKNWGKISSRFFQMGWKLKPRTKMRWMAQFHLLNTWGNIGVTKSPTDPNSPWGSIHFQGLQGEIFAQKNWENMRYPRWLSSSTEPQKRDLLCLEHMRQFSGKLTNRWLENGPFNLSEDVAPHLTWGMSFQASLYYTPEILVNFDGVFM